MHLSVGFGAGAGFGPPFALLGTPFASCGPLTCPLPDGGAAPLPFVAAVDCCASVDVTVVLDTACLEPLDLLPLEDPGNSNFY